MFAKLVYLTKNNQSFQSMLGGLAIILVYLIFWFLG